MPDANTGGAPSTSSDAKTEDSSTQETVEQTSEETEVEQTSEETESEEATTEETGEQTSEEQTKTQAEVDEKEEQVEPKVEKTIDKPEDEKLPFNIHPRFKELVAEKNQYRQEIETVKPLVEQAKVTNEFLRDNQITGQEYQSALQYLMLLRKDPVQAFKMLQPTYEQLALLAGERLPTDLQAEVAAGTLPSERAQELAKARAQMTYNQWKGQTQQVQQQGSQQEVVVGTIQSWVATKQAADPDFKVGSPLWEQVDLRVKSMPPFRTAQEAMTGSEKAYTEAKAFFAKFQPRIVTAAKRPLQSRTTASGNNQVVKTAEDVMQAINAGKKPHQLRYS